MIHGPPAGRRCFGAAKPPASGEANPLCRAITTSTSHAAVVYKLAASIDAIGTAYSPHTQAPPMGRLRWLAIRSAGDSAAVVRAVRAALVEIDADLPLSDIQTMTERTTRH